MNDEFEEARTRLRATVSALRRARSDRTDSAFLPTNPPSVQDSGNEPSSFQVSANDAEQRPLSRNDTEQRPLTREDVIRELGNRALAAANSRFMESQMGGF